MKYPAEFEITELANSQPTAGPEPNAAVDQRQSTQDNLRDGLQEVIGELIRQRRNLEEQLNEERDEHVRESRSLYMKLLVIVDSLERLIRLTNPENELANSLNAVRAEFMQVLEDREIIPIPLKVGDIFDKETCEASSRKLRTDLPAYSIISIERRGYAWRAKTLRRASVVISMLPKGE